MTTSDITWTQHAPEVTAITVSLVFGMMYVITRLLRMWYESFKYWFSSHAEEHRNSSEAIRTTLLRLTSLESEHNIIQHHYRSNRDYEDPQYQPDQYDH